MWARAKIATSCHTPFHKIAKVITSYVRAIWTPRTYQNMQSILLFHDLIINNGYNHAYFMFDYDNKINYKRSDNQKGMDDLPSPTHHPHPPPTTPPPHTHTPHTHPLIYHELKKYEDLVQEINQQNCYHCLRNHSDPNCIGILISNITSKHEE